VFCVAVHVLRTQRPRFHVLLCSRPAGPGPAGPARPHDGLRGDGVRGLPGPRLCGPREEPGPLQVSTHTHTHTHTHTRTHTHTHTRTHTHTHTRAHTHTHTHTPCGHRCSAHRSGQNLGSFDTWMTIAGFAERHAGAYACRPVPPQNVQSPAVWLALGRE